MAPRRRPPKPRTSRMDAAIDAMKPYGFAKEVVTTKMRQLLKEYEGEYMFIELDAYAVLLDSLISDQEQEVATRETSNSVNMEGEEVKDDHAIVVTDRFTDIPVCSSTTHTVLPPPPPPPISEADLPSPPHVLPVALPQPENVQPRMRKPCYGWISDDDDDEELQFIILPSSFNKQISPPAEPETPHQHAQPELTSGRKNRPRRRSRWDLRPEDM